MALPTYFAIALLFFNVHAAGGEILECQIYKGNDTIGELQETLQAYPEVDLGTHFDVSRIAVYDGQEFHFHTFFRKGLKNIVTISSGGYLAMGFAETVDGPSQVLMAAPGYLWLRFRCAIVQ
ncbi:MAG: hypothetical protein ACXVBW_05330 [Bdellovibrionota bacterium]